MMKQTLQYVDNYDAEDVYRAVCRSFEALDIASDLRPGMKVAIKPNLIIAKGPEAVATTHPEVIRAVGRWLTEQGVTDITLAESSGGLYNAEYMKRIYRVTGVESVKEYMKLNMDFSARNVECREGFANHSFHLITPIVEADYIINICKLKTHSMTGYSGGIKNLFGTIPGLEKPQMHYRWPEIEDFSNMLLELAQTVNPQVTVIDAIDAMEGDGPTGGTCHPLHMLLASRDCYTQDYFAAGLMGIKPEEIVMIRQAVERGLAKPEEMELVGDPVPEGLTPFVKPRTIGLDFVDSVPRIFRRPFQWVAKHFLRSYPQLIPEKCVGCGKCAESCPAHVIEIRNRKARFGRRKCISCFCCQEMCPMKAITVKKAFMKKK